MCSWIFCSLKFLTKGLYHYCFRKKALYSRGGVKITVLRNTQPIRNNPFMLWIKILGCKKLKVRKLEVRKSKSTLNVISQLQFLIDYRELWYTTIFWSSKTKYGIKKFIRLIVFFFLRIFKKYILVRFGHFFD